MPNVSENADIIAMMKHYGVEGEATNENIMTAYARLLKDTPEYSLDMARNRPKWIDACIEHWQFYSRSPATQAPWRATGTCPDCHHIVIYGPDGEELEDIAANREMIQAAPEMFDLLLRIFLNQGEARDGVQMSDYHALTRLVQRVDISG